MYDIKVLEIKTGQVYTVSNIEELLPSAWSVIDYETFFQEVQDPTYELPFELLKDKYGFMGKPNQWAVMDDDGVIDWQDSKEDAIFSALSEEYKPAGDRLTNYEITELVEELLTLRGLSTKTKMSSLSDSCYVTVYLNEDSDYTIGIRNHSANSQTKCNHIIWTNGGITEADVQSEVDEIISEVFNNNTTAQSYPQNHV